MNGYLTEMLTTQEAKDVMARAEAYFAGGVFSDLTDADLADWQKNVFSKVKDAYGVAVDAFAGLVNGSMKAWRQNPSDQKAAGKLLNDFEALAKAIFNEPAPAVNRLDDVKAFRDSCFSTMATMALTTENATRDIPRTDSVKVVISKAHMAVTCEDYVDRFGEMPATARIGKDELASTYWESMMDDVAPFSKTENNQILKDLKTLETSTNVSDIPKSMDSLVKNMLAVTKKNDDPREYPLLPGQAEMVFAEAMRSDKVMAGGAYRDDQPDHRAPAKLTDTERKEMKTTIDDRKEERRKEEHAEPTGGRR